MLNKTLMGLVVELPGSRGTGVVMDATRQGRNIYKATIVCENGDILIAQFKTDAMEIGKVIKYLDYSFFDAKQIATLL